VADGPLWIHEIKHDGYRLICRRDSDQGSGVHPQGTTGPIARSRIAKPLQSLRLTSATIDGEAVVHDSTGITDFDRLRSALARQGSRVPFRPRHASWNDSARGTWTMESPSRRGPRAARARRARSTDVDLDQCACRPVLSDCRRTQGGSHDDSEQQPKDWTVRSDR